MKRLRDFISLFTLLTLLGCSCDESSEDLESAIADLSDTLYDGGITDVNERGPMPFIYTSLVLYGRFGPTYPEDCFPLSVAKMFHLLETGPGNHSTTRWCEVRKDRSINAFEYLKQNNPNIKIYLYRMGPGQYAVSKYDKQDQENWEWIKANHGKDSSDRWISIGVYTEEYLRSVPYPIERAMILGNPNWQEYWLDYNYKKVWGEPLPQYDGKWSDGIFLDGMQYGVSWQNKWRPESSYDETTGQWISTDLDHPDAYYDVNQNKYLNDLWQKHYDEFIRKAVFYFESKGLLLGLNSWRISKPSQISLYEDVGILVMEECGFLCWKVPSVDEWEQKIKTMQEAKNYTILSVNMPPGATNPNNSGPDPEEGLQRMDRIYEGRTGWQWLWFALASYLLGYNPEKPNAYFLFSMWNFRDQYWFEEYDTALLNLGTPVNLAQKSETGVWWREFEKGYVVANPYSDGKEFKINGGKQVRILTHENFKDIQSAELKSAGDGITLEPYQGAIMRFE